MGEMVTNHAEDGLPAATLEELLGEASLLLSHAEALADYARRAGGPADDLDPELEAAGIDHLLATEDHGVQER
jgi:hypothetical protein